MTVSQGSGRKDMGGTGGVHGTIVSSLGHHVCISDLLASVCAAQISSS
jgi:hypothetical protein